MGRITASRKQLKPDPMYGSILAAKFINTLMHDGKNPDGNMALLVGAPREGMKDVP